MLDPIKVSILAREWVKMVKWKKPVFRRRWSLLWLVATASAPPATTDFQIMFLFLMGVTRGKWRLGSAPFGPSCNAPQRQHPAAQAMPELVEQYPEHLRQHGHFTIGLHHVCLARKQPWRTVDEAYSGLPMAEITPREAYNAIVDNNVELVSISNLPGRIAANSVIPYPPGIPMLLSGEDFGDKTVRK
ncbi:hypothetical protein ACLK19_27805 [Escherichia coli]